jgi:hypothetical protein
LLPPWPDERSRTSAAAVRRVVLQGVGFFVIEHGRRKSLHFNVTRHPTAEWVLQQLREAFPEAAPYRYVILDRDSKFDAEVIKFLKATGLGPKRTSVQAPWQNGPRNAGWAVAVAKSSTMSSR